MPVVFGTHPQLSHEDLRNRARAHPLRHPRRCTAKPNPPGSAPQARDRQVSPCEGRPPRRSGFRLPPSDRGAAPMPRAHPHRGKRDFGRSPTRVAEPLAPVRAAVREATTAAEIAARSREPAARSHRETRARAERESLHGAAELASRTQSPSPSALPRSTLRSERRVTKNPGRANKSSPPAARAHWVGPSAASSRMAAVETTFHALEFPSAPPSPEGHARPPGDALAHERQRAPTARTPTPSLTPSPIAIRLHPPPDRSRAQLRRASAHPSARALRGMRRHPDASTLRSPCGYAPWPSIAKRFAAQVIPAHAGRRARRAKARGNFDPPF